MIVIEFFCLVCFIFFYIDFWGFIIFVGYYIVNIVFFDIYFFKIIVIIGYKYLRNLFNVYVIFYFKKYGDKYILLILKI